MDTLIYVFSFVVLIGLAGQLTVKSKGAFKVRLAFAVGFVMAQFSLVTILYCALRLFIPEIPLGTTAWLIGTLLTIPLVLLVQPYSVGYKKKNQLLVEHL